ncbi:MAG: 16S rRNA (guanine(966)-N(2))-methyltransferase RsmD [Nitrospirae bacterium]|nr:MAG: 16S rRNA (guanine(966)-N(2))-methyltransferase RsmD [Nitrospirota bacterium]
MQIIAGSQKGRRLSPPKGGHVRPTAAKVREALFNIVGARVIGAQVLDLYAGSGAVGIEAWSRGARRVVFVEQDPAALSVLRRNLVRCGMSAETQVWPWNVWRFFHLPSLATWDPLHLVFADPPYVMKDWERLLSNISRYVPLAEDAMVIIEHHRKTVLPLAVESLEQIRRVRYGDTVLTLFERQSVSFVQPNPQRDTH